MQPRYRAQVFSTPRRGMSLIELMVALTLGLLLIAGVIQLFTGTRMTYMSNESLARVQENGRFALEVLRQPTRQALTRGFCGHEIPIRNHLNTTGTPNIINHIFSPDMAIAGWEYTNTSTAPGGNVTVNQGDLTPVAAGNHWNATDQAGGAALILPSEITGATLPLSDVLMIRVNLPLTGVTGNPNGPSGPGATTLDLDTTARPGGLTLNGGEIMLATNCDNADMFQNSVAGENITQLDRGTGFAPGNDPGAGNWGVVSNNTLQVYRPVIYFYYVGINVAGEPSLFRYDMSRGANPGTAAEELVQGVENMQILYGYSLPGSAGGDGQGVDHWLTAAQVPDWRLVTAVHIAMLLRSPESAGDAAMQTFNLAGTNVTVNADPQRARQAVQTTVGLRNRYMVNE